MRSKRPRTWKCRVTEPASMLERVAGCRHSSNDMPGFIHSNKREGVVALCTHLGLLVRLQWAGLLFRRKQTKIKAERTSNAALEWGVDMSVSLKPCSTANL
jgi:hypothetical protein